MRPRRQKINPQTSRNRSGSESRWGPAYRNDWALAPLVKGVTTAARPLSARGTTLARAARSAVQRGMRGTAHYAGRQGRGLYARAASAAAPSAASTRLPERQELGPAHGGAPVPSNGVRTAAFRSADPGCPRHGTCPPGGARRGRGCVRRARAGGITARLSRGRPRRHRIEPESKEQAGPRRVSPGFYPGPGLGSWGRGPPVAREGGPGDCQEVALGVETVPVATARGSRIGPAAITRTRPATDARGGGGASAPARTAPARQDGRALPTQAGTYASKRSDRKPLASIIGSRPRGDRPGERRP